MGASGSVNYELIKDEEKNKYKNIGYFPQILKIHSDNDKIFLKTEINEYRSLDIQTYLDIIKSNDIKDSNELCKDINKDKNELDELDYCLKCKKYICKKCLYENHNTHKEKCIPLFKSENICSIHNKEANINCKECEKNVCSKCFDDYHKFHKKFEFKKSDINNARNIIIEKIKTLEKMMEFYELIQSAYEKDNDNYLFRNNYKKIQELIEKEKNRDDFDKDLAIYRIEQLKNGI